LQIEAINGSQVKWQFHDWFLRDVANLG